ncbi:hypothetical protein K0U27_03050 [archaeon]|nr:hypothetical protein [archaeon]
MTIVSRTFYTVKESLWSLGDGGDLISFSSYYFRTVYADNVAFNSHKNEYIV